MGEKKNKRIIKERNLYIHSLGHCQDCNEQLDNFHEPLAVANHVKETGHTVILERGYSQKYRVEATP